MSSAKINEYKLLIPKIKTRAKALKNRSSRKVQRINLVTDPTLALVSTTDILNIPNIKKENVFKIIEFFENIVLKQAKLDLEESKNDYKDLYLTFKNSIINQLNLVESAFTKLNARTAGFAAKFFDNFGNGSFNDDGKLLEGLEQLITSFASKSTAPTDDELFKKIKTYLDNEKDAIIDKLKNINFNISKEPVEIKLGIFNNSLVLKPEEHQMVNEWIKERVGSQKSFELVFNTKDHGFTAKAFHEKCDNKGPTLVLIENTYGKRFGGYAAVSWNSSGTEIKESNSFLFSIDFKECYLHKNNGTSSLGYFSISGPYFGGGVELHIHDNCNNNFFGSCGLGTSYDCKSRTINDIFGGTHYAVKHYEAYLIKQK